ncbi:MAG: APC family permease [Nitrospiraceae bacterium]|nr:APC family permease [Nitrospiraceae bacterium]
MSIKEFLIGSPIESIKEKHERLTKTLGLAVFSSDALSSVAYGTEEIMIALLAGGAALLHLTMPIAITIVALVTIVATSYFQTIHAYPSGGGAYIVAKDNLGAYPGLVAGAALLVDYVLTVTVSISAGVAAITSAFPALAEHAIALCLFAIFAIMIVNLRGVRESGKVVSFPVYAFVGGLSLLIAAGLFKWVAIPGPGMHKEVASAASGALPLFIILRAFASGCATLTGIEAISNGVRAFKEPEAKNAASTLALMAVILGALTLGIAFLAQGFHILPKENETVLSQLARAVFHTGPIYYLIQFSTALILILAANTSFADFPRLSSIMAADRYLPRQLSNRGDRLVFSNGILILGIVSAVPIIIFGGNTNALIPLYAVGVFTAFTLSQAGMVKHWYRLRGEGWVKSIIINSVGTIATFVVFLIIAVTKFMHGAWIVVLAIPGLVLLTRKIHSHYLDVAKELSLETGVKEAEYSHHTVIIPLSGVHRAVLKAVKYGKALSDDVKAVYVVLDMNEAKKLEEKWKEFGMGVPLILLHSPYRSVSGPLMDYIESVQAEYPAGVITVILPEFVPLKWWHHLLHNQTALLIKGKLLFKKGVVSTSVPLRLQR